jgi:hypothetical protein
MVYSYMYVSSTGMTSSSTGITVLYSPILPALWQHAFLEQEPAGVHVHLYIYICTNQLLQHIHNDRQGDNGNTETDHIMLEW